MATPDPQQMIQQAGELFNEALLFIGPVLGVLMGLMVLAIVHNLIESAMGISTAAGDVVSNTVRNPIDPEEWGLRMQAALREDDEPEDLYGVSPVQCPKCNGVTDIAGSGGRCKYCNTPLRVDGGRP